MICVAAKGRGTKHREVAKGQCSITEVNNNGTVTIDYGVTQQRVNIRRLFRCCTATRMRVNDDKLRLNCRCQFVDRMRPNYLFATFLLLKCCRGLPRSRTTNVNILIYYSCKQCPS
ncbi:hypothetical protein PHMEG_00023856 [Phytophthora megakarya]|uniref:Uncharacterized protein n=1 Tax=Phytophthora megakarya TaxID=4795 RepID=A0A225VHC2_9STRA|nr:hypothetical protein PHMEG_00023856 [Phytophthora megakarya]